MTINYDKCYKENQQSAWDNPTFDIRVRKVSLIKRN